MHLLSRIQRHLRRTGTSPTAFGREVVHDPRFVHDLRNGREPRVDTERRIHAWLDAHEGIVR
jgi:2,4-dienoyl-CoA reductase-like NADH-dependent reductase (Old Yellow Enzyme family)